MLVTSAITYVEWEGEGGRERREGREREGEEGGREKGGEGWEEGREGGKE